MATFMAKWSEQLPGQSGHLHVSLTRKSGSSAFYDQAAAHTMSEEMRWFVGGQQTLMPELLAMVASTVNSYSRLVPGFWAPTSATETSNRLRTRSRKRRTELRFSLSDRAAGR